MQQYIGTKIIHGEPMDRLTYNEKFGRNVPDRNGDEGHTVIYGKGTDREYRSWSPAQEFDAAYRSTTGMNFGLAIEAAIKGANIARAGWNGKNMFLFVRVACVAVTGAEIESIVGIKNVQFPPIFCMKTADDKVVEGWLASQTDMFADDWVVVD